MSNIYLIYLIELRITFRYEEWIENYITCSNFAETFILFTLFLVNLAKKGSNLKKAVVRTVGYLNKLDKQDHSFQIHVEIN